MNELNNNTEDDGFDEIREPDKVIREQLVQDNRCEFQKQMDEAMYLSMQDAIRQEKIFQDYEEKIINEYVKETITRKETFNKLLMDMNKLIKFDKFIKEIYEIIEPIIDNYCQKYIEIWEIDEETYEKIFKILSTIRSDKEAIEKLKTIIVKS